LSNIIGVGVEGIGIDLKRNTNEKKKRERGEKGDQEAFIFTVGV
jgi:hypothetical protein